MRDLTKGWSYTALSRARGTTRLHVDAAAVSARVLEREEHAPTRQGAADRAQVVARAAAQMIVRDDEDLAVSQLPVRPAPGRPDDRELHSTPRLRADELAELGAGARSSTGRPARPARAASPSCSASASSSGSSE